MRPDPVYYEPEGGLPEKAIRIHKGFAQEPSMQLVWWGNKTLYLNLEGQSYKLVVHDVQVPKDYSEAFSPVGNKV